MDIIKTIIIFVALAILTYELFTFTESKELRIEDDLQNNVAILHRDLRFGRKKPTPPKPAPFRGRTTKKRPKTTRKPKPTHHRNDDKTNKNPKIRQFKRATKRYFWREGARAVETRIPKLGKCIVQRCTRDAICRNRVGGKCLYCNIVTKRCTIYTKLARGQKCGNDRDCSGKTICAIPKRNILLRAPPGPSCVLQDEVEHKLEYSLKRQNPGETRPFTSDDVRQMREQHPERKWPDPSTIYTAQSIDRHRRLFTEDSKGVSFMVRMPEIPRNSVAKLNDDLERYIKMVFPEQHGFPVVPTKEMEKYSKMCKTHNCNDMVEKFGPVTFWMPDPPNDPKPGVLLRVDVPSKFVSGIRLRSGNEPWSIPDKFMPGGKTRGENGVPEAIIDTPSGIQNAYWLKDDRYPAAPSPWAENWQTDTIRFGNYSLRPNPLRPNQDLPNWRQSWHERDHPLICHPNGILGLENK